MRAPLLGHEPVVLVPIPLHCEQVEHELTLDAGQKLVEWRMETGKLVEAELTESGIPSDKIQHLSRDRIPALYLPASMWQRTAMCYLRDEGPGGSDDPMACTAVGADRKCYKRGRPLGT